MFNKKDDEVDKLKKEVGDLKTLVKYLATAVDKVSTAQGLLSSNVNDLVDAQRESLKIQEKLAKTSLEHSEKLDQIDSGVKNLLHKLLPPSDR